jgi:hypothetical protein
MAADAPAASRIATAKEHRRRIRDAIGPDQFRRLARVSWRRTAGTLAAHWLSLAALLGAANLTPLLPWSARIPVSAVLIVLIGTRRQRRERPDSRGVPRAARPIAPV